MTITVCVDPGKHALAYSVWENTKFRWAYLVQGNRAQMFRAVAKEEPTMVICELPVAYPGSRTGGDPNDLIQVAASAGAAMGACDCSITVQPVQWKGQLPKEIHHERLRKGPGWVYAMDSCLATVPVNLRHNVLDAIGIGLWAFGDGKRFVETLAESLAGQYG